MPGPYDPLARRCALFLQTGEGQGLLELNALWVSSHPRTKLVLAYSLTYVKPLTRLI